MLRFSFCKSRTLNVGRKHTVLIEAIRQALTPYERVCFTVYTSGYCSQREVARITHTNLTAVQRAILRSEKKLRKYFSGQSEEPKQ